MMNIDCYLSPECSTEEGLRENIARALALAGGQANVKFHRIEDQEALALGLSGSPSVFINAKELQPLNSVGFS